MSDSVSRAESVARCAHRSIGQTSRWRESCRQQHRGPTRLLKSLCYLSCGLAPAAILVGSVHVAQVYRAGAHPDGTLLQFPNDGRCRLRVMTIGSDVENAGADERPAANDERRDGGDDANSYLRCAHAGIH
jgi:hypothetical protein